MSCMTEGISRLNEGYASHCMLGTQSCNEEAGGMVAIETRIKE
jgi:hypothetical protein